MPSGCSGAPAPLTFVLGTVPCSQPKMFHPGHGGSQAEPQISPCTAPLLHLGWGWHQLQRCPCGRGRTEGCPQTPAHTLPKSGWGEEVEPQGHPCHLAGAAAGPGSATWAALGPLWAVPGVPRGCSWSFHASCSPGRLIPSASPECGAG